MYRGTRQVHIPGYKQLSNLRAALCIRQLFVTIPCMSDQSIPLPLSETNGRSERSDAVANRAHILEVARELFETHGPEQVTISDIVQAAEVGRGTVYRHFPSKGELCLALIDDSMRVFQNGMLIRLQEMVQAAQPPLEQLATFLDLLMRYTIQNMPLMLESQRQGIYYYGKMEPQTWQVSTVRGLLETAVLQGTLPRTLNTAFLADALLATLNAPLLNFQLEERGFTVEELSGGLKALIGQLRS